MKPTAAALPLDLLASAAENCASAAPRSAPSRCRPFATDACARLGDTAGRPGCVWMGCGDAGGCGGAAVGGGEGGVHACAVLACGDAAGCALLCCGAVGACTTFACVACMCGLCGASAPLIGGANGSATGMSAEPSAAVSWCAASSARGVKPPWLLPPACGIAISHKLQPRVCTGCCNASLSVRSRHARGTVGVAHLTNTGEGSPDR